MCTAMLHSRQTALRRAGFVVVALLAALALLEGVSRVVVAAGRQAAAVTPAPCRGHAAMACVDLDVVPDVHAADMDGGTIMVRHPRRRWALRAHAPLGRYPGNRKVRTNALGLRGVPLPQRGNGEARLMVLGDSSIFGEGVAEQDTFVVVAARLLAELWGRPVTPVNGGVPGYDSGQSAELLREMAPRVRPTHVVIANIWSDIYAQDRRQNLAVDSSGSTLPLRHLALYRLIYRMVMPLLRPVRVGFISRRGDIGGRARPTRVSLANYAANLDHLAQEAARHGAQPVFLLLPAPMDFSGRAVPDTVSDFREAMRQAARRHSASLVDGLARFREVPSPGDLFFDKVHPNVRGNQLLGQILARAIGGARQATR